MPRLRPAGCKVSIQNNNGSIKLIYQHNNKRHFLSLGLPYTKNNLDIATAKAWEIHNDIIFNRYDGNEKYKTGFSKNEIKQEITLTEIWQFYQKIRSDTSLISKNNQWKKISNTLLLFDHLSPTQVDIFAEHLLKNYSKTTVKRLLQDLSAAIQLSIDYGKYDGKNPLPKII